MMNKILVALTLSVSVAACGGSSSQAPATSSTTAAASAAPAAAAGPKAADFTLTDSEGQQVALHDLLVKGPVILAFFPKAFTGGCTKEMTGYTERTAKVQAKGAQIVAVSIDDPATLKKFKESLGANFAFLSDPQGKVASQYGGLMDNGMAKRATFVIAQDGTIGHTDQGTDSINPDPAVEACPNAGAAKKI